ncbi:hypothetical protein GGR54DRAFT_616158 [Hypoxylon sp. NC1633]|nr:hypothetical protein GGR54DRAFT_616158 [Hypoxylon sp. NC1633]
MQPRRYPPILPSAPLQPEPEPDPGRRRQRPGACTPCRSRKTKCDGARPRCSNCVRRGIIACVYADKAKAGSEVMEVLELLKSLPEEHALTLLGELREKGDATTVLSAFKERGGDGGRVSPELIDPGPSKARNHLESELMVNNSEAYPSLRPINAFVLAKSNLLRPVQRIPVEAGGSDFLAPIEIDSVGRRFQLPLSPGQEVSYCDEQLRDLQVSFWTDVDITDEFAARVISLYITTDHPILGVFSPDLFIADLVNKRNKYCSRFLFHSLMYLGCQMYTAFDKSATHHSTEFFEESERLWKKEQVSYLTMAGAVLLSLSLIGSGRDHAVLSYATQAIEMGEQLGLFEAGEAALMGPDENLPEEDKKARCYAAWGTFNWNVHVSLFYRQPGSESPNSAPLVPIPGSTHQGDSIYGSHLADDGHLEMIFPQVCRFWQIIYRAEWIYNPGHNSPPTRFRMALAEHTFRELIAWAEALPPSLLRSGDRSQHATVLHIWLHAAVLDVFRPFIGRLVGQRSRLTTFLARDSSPEAVYAASVNQLKRLVVEYRSDSAASTYSILWHTGLIYLANAMLKDTEDPEWRLYLLLCIYGYESLSRPYRISEAIVQGLLSMTMRESNMTGSEAHRIITELREGRLEGIKNDFEDGIRAKFMVDMELALEDPEKAKAENLAAQFDDLALFQDFLNRDEMEV